VKRDRNPVSASAPPGCVPGLVAGLLLLLGACSAMDPSARDPSLPDLSSGPRLTPVTQTYRDLTGLPEPKGRIATAVYGFRDQTGQYKPLPDSNFSTAVTQGAGSMLVKALLDSGWFIPVEREGLQDLLTERRIIRAQEKPETPSKMPQLMSASILLQGGVVAYETNVKTGGAGVRYFGLGVSDLYRTDQVTVNLRAVDVRNGKVVQSVSTTKTILSVKVGADLFRFVSYGRLLEAEVGMTRNEPSQLCVQEAIQAAVAHLIVQGVHDRQWQLKNPQDIHSPVFQAYMGEQTRQLAASDLAPEQARPPETTPPAEGTPPPSLPRDGARQDDKARAVEPRPPAAPEQATGAKEHPVALAPASANDQPPGSPASREATPVGDSPESARRPAGLGQTASSPHAAEMPGQRAEPGAKGDAPAQSSAARHAGGEPAPRERQPGAL
jgi:curli production assembly/transport component CsgG